MTENNQPTDKQAKAMELIREGVAPTKAMLQAGYSKSVSQAPSRNLLRSEGAKTIIEQYKDAYTKVGITPGYMGEKTKEWLEAHKIKSSITEPDKIVPDYETQLKAAEMVRKDWGIENEGQGIIVENKILVVPGELIEKYDKTPTSDTENSSKG